MIVYTHPDCTYSEALKDELREAGTVYEEINLALKPDQWPKLEELTGGERITPVTRPGRRGLRRLPRSRLKFLEPPGPCAPAKRTAFPQVPHLRHSRERGNPSPTGCTTMTPEAARHAPRPIRWGI